MMIARVGEKSPGNLLVFVLEPGNIANLQVGKPIVKRLHEFFPDLPEDLEILIAYSPDTPFVSERIKKGDDFGTAIEKSLLRPENFRPGEDVEAVKKAPIPK